MPTPTPLRPNYGPYKKSRYCPHCGIDLLTTPLKWNVGDCPRCGGWVK